MGPTALTPDPTLDPLPIMRRHPWFAQLPEALQLAIVARARPVRLAHGQLLFRKRDPADAWWGILQGAIRIGAASAEGRELTLTYLEPGAWFGEISLFDGEPRTHDGQAQGATVLLRVARPDFDALLAEHPALARALLQLQSQRLRMMFGLIESASLLPLPQRLAQQLLSLASTYGEPGPQPGTVHIALRLPQDALGQLLGTSRQRINQALKTWERDGWLHQRYGEIVLLNLAALEAEAEG
jgi:CRP/FNR family transcriptional regulator, cyclic AMP receptor protein